MTARPALRLAAVAFALVAATACTRREPEVVQTDPPTTTAPTTPTTPPTTTVPVAPVTGETIAAGSVRDFTINVGDRIYFDFDSFAIRADAQPRLQAQADWLRRYPNVRVRIEGNADERGTREYNFALGARRAEAVRAFLISRGIDGSRIDTISYGKERPIADGANEEAWARNRNAHTAITSGAPQ